MMEGERKLATVRRIAKIEPIEGADRIVKATIDGWELVTQKDNYKVGDLCVYFEIDSFLPVREEFEFLRKGCFKSTTNLGDGFRIKTIKLKGQISQGLSLPLKDVFGRQDEGGFFFYNGENKIYAEEGTDVTEYCRVQKYEKPLPKEGGGGANMGRAKANFPDFIPKTDQDRVQNCLGAIKKWIYYGEPVVTELTDLETVRSLEAGNYIGSAERHYFKSGDMWFVREYTRNDDETIAKRRVFETTMKLDGSSMTVYHNDGRYGVCSRNLEVRRDTENVFWKTVLATDILPSMVRDGRNLAIQGELMGPGVQGNREKFEDHKFFVFDIYDIDQKRYLTSLERETLMSQVESDPNNNAFNHVPLVWSGFAVITEETSVSDLLAMVEIKSINHDIAEGVVFKSVVDGSKSFKVINNKYLLAEKD
jgi:RNA ligase (TIGR02306 family)